MPRPLPLPEMRIHAEAMPSFLPGDGRRVTNRREIADVQLQRYSHRTTLQGIGVPAVAEPLLVLVLAGNARVEERSPGEDWVANTVGTGDFFLTTSTEPYEMRWTSEGEFQVAHLYLSQRLLDRAGQDLLGAVPSPIRLRDVSGGRDETLSRLALPLLHELEEQPEASPLFVLGLAQALAVHLVRHYRDAQATRPAGALPMYRLRRVLAHMREHLAEPFSLSAAAAEAGLSDYHFSRLFRRATGLSPSQCFIQLRMEQARRLLATTDRAIIDIALEVGYASPSHFAQVFRRATGVAPSLYRQG